MTPRPPVGSEYGANRVFRKGFYHGISSHNVPKYRHPLKRMDAGKGGKEVNETAQGDRFSLAPGDHAAILCRHEGEMEEVAGSLLDQCGRKGWRLLYITRSTQQNPAVERLKNLGGYGKGAIMLSHEDPEFHRNFASARSAHAYIIGHVESARSAGYSALCILREVPPIAARRSSQQLVSDMAGLDVLLGEKSLLLLCCYQMDLFSPAVLQDVLRTHPRIILDNRLIENLFYIPATDAMRYNLPSLELKHWLDTLLKLSLAKEELSESESRFQDLLENANDLIQSVGPDGKFLYVNRAWRETMEYGPDEIPGLNLFDIIDPSSMEHCRVLFGRVMAGEDVGRIEATFRSRSGRRVYVEGRVNCHMENGVPQYTRAIFRDVTELKKEEMARREREQVLDAVLNLTPHATVVTTPDGTMLYANKPARSLSPVTGKEGVHGKPFWSLLSPGGEDEVRRSMGELFEAGGEGTSCRVRGCDGRDWEIEWSRARFGSGESRYLMAVIRRVE
ncbi:MAG: putative diguanylate cyclase [Methanoregulaceae archaeon PtaB.Bin056]|jgi:PAS domain S-box-containing protein|nr:MAG: putative diguanylate cyclase [Methanoregulaceae archaeon PtaB.Bin056]